jgi:ketosteroid isomerase-like protein
MSRRPTQISVWITTIVLGLLFTVSAFANLTKNESPIGAASETDSTKIDLNAGDGAEQIVRNYFRYLYKGNTDAIVDLYSDDAVLMPADLPTTTGKKALATAYNQTFSAIKFISATTDYDEVSVVGNIAIVRTTSVANLFMIKEQQAVQSKMCEFFILTKEKEEWKISRYMFNREL